MENQLCRRSLIKWSFQPAALLFALLWPYPVEQLHWLEGSLASLNVQAKERVSAAYKSEEGRSTPSTSRVRPTMSGRTAEVTGTWSTVVPTRKNGRWKWTSAGTRRAETWTSWTVPSCLSFSPCCRKYPKPHSRFSSTSKDQETGGKPWLHKKS